jgi:hypothetical protein
MLFVQLAVMTNDEVVAKREQAKQNFEQQKAVKLQAEQAVNNAEAEMFRFQGEWRALDALLPANLREGPVDPATTIEAVPAADKESSDAPSK